MTSGKPGLMSPNETAARTGFACMEWLGESDMMITNQNPRIGVLLKHGGASVRLYNVLDPRFGMRGLNWLKKNWPEERLRREVPGYGELVSLEWNHLLLKRDMRDLLNHVLEHHSSTVMTPDVCPCCVRGPGKKLMERVARMVAASPNAPDQRPERENP